ncbi:DNA-3-methyladenine glycosylase [Sporohalobacter salinus]|uniref:DNA-3-methyladenine glycosylase n=1 Tax=Sporohalobacter salinus TaxID=1494606 RepID=UPI00196201CE|nr:DNA-3-methyladenine glycosylase [Sporohalobacter salinus]MBM7623665.1 DNA-3-methyladenine glycosylase [Sporohalobacter salinus]
MKLGYDFYKQDAVTVAKQLIGKLLIRKLKSEEIICRIVGTEAYVGPEDKGCHAYQNKKTKRTKVMFNQGGCAYVYLIYGKYSCFNVVTNKENKPEAVFIRAVEPLKGLEVIKKNRNIKSNKVENLTNGPGKLSQALEIDKELNDYDLIFGDELYIKKEKQWRFYIKENSFVSV